jgi:hypothetical protein
MTITILLVIIVMAVVILSAIMLSSKTVPKGIDKQYFMHEWSDITEIFKDDKTKPLSIIHADKLLDEALKCLAFKGNTMGERLASARPKLKHRDQVWYAHKLRNKIVHETGYKPTDKQARSALKGYYHTFKDLGVW